MATHASDNDDDADVPLGEVPEGVGADLYPKHLDDLRRDHAFDEAVLSFRDTEGRAHEVPLDDITGTEQAEEGGNRTRILLRNGAIVIATGAVIAGAIAAVRYRRRHR